MKNKIVSMIALVMVVASLNAHALEIDVDKVVFDVEKITEKLKCAAKDENSLVTIYIKQKTKNNKSVAKVFIKHADEIQANSFYFATVSEDDSIYYTKKEYTLFDTNKMVAGELILSKENQNMTRGGGCTRVSCNQLPILTSYAGKLKINEKEIYFTCY